MAMFSNKTPPCIFAITAPQKAKLTIYALAEQVVQGVVNVGRMPTITDSRSHPGNKACLSLDAVQQQCAEIGGNGATVEVGADGKAGDGGKTQLCRGRIGQGWSRLASLRSVIGVTPILSIG